MDKEKQRKEISRKICERCDNFDRRACRVNRTGECSLAKDSAECILAMGYGNLREFVKGIEAELDGTPWEGAMHLIKQLLKECTEK